MADITLILDRTDLFVRMDSGTLRIDYPDTTFRRVPLNMIARVIVVGKPAVTCDVWRNLGQNHVPVILLPLKGDTFPVYIGPGLNMSARIRMDQYRVKTDGKRTAEIARRIFGMKLEGQISVLRDFGKDDTETEASCEKIGMFRKNMETAEETGVMMGYEGSAAAEYFRALARLIPEKWNFTGRNRRPPKDPVNALLSLSYVLAGGEVRSAVCEKGLDPAMGLVHSVQDYRESLVLDILEPLRPMADAFVLRLINEKLSLKEFFIQKENSGCFLNKTGRKIYYAEWAGWMGSSEGNLKNRAREIVDNFVDGFFSFS